MFKSLLISFFMLMNVLHPVALSSAADVISELNKNFSRGDSKAIADHFANTIELIINEEEDIYSRSQAEIILRDFFSKNSPKKCEQVHLINKPNSIWYVFNLQTNSGVFRTILDVKIESSNYIITSIKIEPSVR